MAIKLFKVPVDIRYDLSSSLFIEVVQCDTNSNVFDISITDSKKPLVLDDDAYVTITFKKADDTVVVGTAEIVDKVLGKVKYTLGTSELTCVGQTEVTLEIYTPTSRLTTKTFYMQVIPQLDNGKAVESKPEYTILNNLIGDVTTLESNVETAESSRVSVENSRVTAENGRASAESTRVSQEETRQAQEITRKNNETSRTEYENVRVSNENARKLNETNRELAEDTRVNNELERQSKENTRVSNENLRVEAENARKSAETIRVSGENERKSQEATRIFNETARVASEQTRKDSFALMQHQDVNLEYANELRNNLLQELSSLSNIVSLTDSKGGRMSVEIQGNTLKNELTYNPSTWAEWNNSAGVIGDSTGLEFTASSFWATINSIFKANTKYGILVRCVSNAFTNNRVVFGNNLVGTYLTLVGAGVTGNIKTIFTTQSSIANNYLTLENANSSDIGLKAKLKDIRIYELPTGSQIESDFNTLTADQLAVKYPFHSGIWSVGEDEGEQGVHKIEVSSFNENLVDLAVKYNELVDKINDNEFRIPKDNVYNISSINLLPSIINSKLTIKCTAKVSDTSKPMFISVFDINKNISYPISFNSTEYVTKSVTVNNAMQVHIVPSASGSGEWFVKDFQISYNATTDFIPPKQDKIDISLTSPLRGLPNGARDIHSSDGIRINKVGKAVLNGSEGWILGDSTKTNTIRFEYTLSTVVNRDSDILMCLADKMPSVPKNTLYPTDMEGIAIIQNQRIIIRILKSKLTTQDVAGFKAWLQANNVTVYYELATPTTEDTGKQLTLQSFKGGSLQVGSLVPPYVKALYPTTLACRITQLEEKEALMRGLTDLASEAPADIVIKINELINIWK